jgi:hypothetical protein
MKHIVLAVTILALVAAPVAADSLASLLPQLTFPETVVTTATKDCAPTGPAICPPEK